MKVCLRERTEAVDVVRKTFNKISALKIVQLVKFAEYHMEDKNVIQMLNNTLIGICIDTYVFYQTDWSGVSQRT